MAERIATWLESTSYPENLRRVRPMRDVSTPVLPTVRRSHQVFEQERRQPKKEEEPHGVRDHRHEDRRRQRRVNAD